MGYLVKLLSLVSPVYTPIYEAKCGRMPSCHRLVTVFDVDDPMVMAKLLPMIVLQSPGMNTQVVFINIT
jgi:hypothetical protein